MFALAGAQRSEELSGLVVRPMQRQGSSAQAALPTANLEAVKRCTEALQQLQTQVEANHQAQLQSVQVRRRSCGRWVAWHEVPPTCAGGGWPHTLL